MANVLITGGRGLVGTALSKRLSDKGYEVAVLSRYAKSKSGIRSFVWDVSSKKIDDEAIDWADFIIHLAGANIGDKRWTKKRKQLILDSRVKTAKLIFEKVKERKKKLKAFISASAIGYYGAVTSEKIFNEDDDPADDFLGKVCMDWEKAAYKFMELDIRTVKIRTAVVLSNKGEMLLKMKEPAKSAVGVVLGSGNQYMPWIHIDDLCGIYIKAIEDESMDGAYNAVAPDHKTNKEFTRALVRTLNRYSLLIKVPALILKLVLGELSVVLLKGSRVSSKKIRDAGYEFRYNLLEDALKRVFSKQV